MVTTRSQARQQRPTAPSTPEVNFKPSIWTFRRDKKTRKIVPVHTTVSAMPVSPSQVLCAFDLHKTLLDPNPKKTSHFIRDNNIWGDQADSYNHSLSDQESTRAVPEKADFPAHMFYPRELESLRQHFTHIRNSLQQRGGSFANVLTSYGSKEDLEFVTGVSYTRVEDFKEKDYEQKHLLRYEQLKNSAKTFLFAKTEVAQNKALVSFQNTLNETFSDMQVMHQLFQLFDSNPSVLLGMKSLPVPKGYLTKEYYNERLYSLDRTLSKGEFGFTKAMIERLQELGIISASSHTDIDDDTKKPIHIVLGDGSQFPPIEKSIYSSTGDVRNAKEAFQEATKTSSNPNRHVVYIEIAIIDNRISIPHRDDAGKFNGEYTPLTDVLSQIEEHIGIGQLVEQGSHPQENSYAPPSLEPVIKEIITDFKAEFSKKIPTAPKDLESDFKYRSLKLIDSLLAIEKQRTTGASQDAESSRRSMRLRLQK